jgi:hypothetical protein
MPLPWWDGEEWELWWNGFLLKSFERWAANQFCVLNAFEKLGWKRSIENPLPHKPNESRRKRQQRLHDTIKFLNRKHRVLRLRFHGDGSGQNIFWTFFNP